MFRKIQYYKCCKARKKNITPKGGNLVFIYIFILTSSRKTVLNKREARVMHLTYCSLLLHINVNFYELPETPFVPCVLYASLSS